MTDDRTATDTTRDHETMTDDTRPTETDRRSTDRTDYKPTLGAVSHTNPYTGEVFGDTQTYGRGRTVAADGGEANAERRTSSEAEASDGGEADAAPGSETLEDVDHTPASEEVDGTQGTFDRGGEGPDDEPDDE